MLARFWSVLGPIQTFVNNQAHRWTQDPIRAYYPSDTNGFSRYSSGLMFTLFLKGYWYVENGD